MPQPLDTLAGGQLCAPRNGSQTPLLVRECEQQGQNGWLRTTGGSRRSRWGFAGLRTGHLLCPCGWAEVSVGAHRRQQHHQRIHRKAQPARDDLDPDARHAVLHHQRLVHHRPCAQRTHFQQVLSTAADQFWCAPSSSPHLVSSIAMYIEASANSAWNCE